MATKRKTSTTAAIDLDKIYKVKLKAPIRIGRQRLRVQDSHRIRGAHLEANLADVESYEAV